MLHPAQKELRQLSNKEKATILKKFFKTKKGEYGEGDLFLGITVPKIRKIARKYSDIYVKELLEILSSKFHEERFLALVILENKFRKAEDQEKIFKIYLKNIKHINNWDLVDISAPKIIGSFLFEKDKTILYKLAKSKNIWKKRIAIISTLFFIKKGKTKDTYKLASILLKDKEDLIHKACGWMLREAGKNNQELLENFLQTNIRKIPRTTLRYSIEKMSNSKRKHYLKL
jgi:3-methyladenine DNA glycosylase AlkD